jgi:hypothetical protein
VPAVAVGAPPPQIPTVESDAMHGLLVRRADAIAGCREVSEEEAELRAITDALGAYEAKGSLFCAV